MPPIGKTYESLRAAVETLPVIDTHEHLYGPAMQPQYSEPITAILAGYVNSDLQSAVGEKAAAVLLDKAVATAAKWSLFQDAWSRMQFTAYARVTKLVLKHEYGVEKITLEALEGLAGRLVDYRDPARFEAALDRCGIRCILANVLPAQQENLLAPDRPFSPRVRPMIPLPELHRVRDFGAVQRIAGWMGRHVTSLDEYLDLLGQYCRTLKERGCPAMKDQSAYTRTIQYGSGGRAEAEALFGLMLDDPRNALGWPQAKPLDDFLFHGLMRIARDLDLPVQIHTGHMAGIRNDVGKTNAAHFRSVLELHREVRFDLFHGNWPYAGDLLFLAKNYPNVAIDCCWLHIIDPRYARRLLADVLVTVPHSKVHGFGGDVGHVEGVAAHLEVARDNIAAALAGMVDQGWLDADQARQVAADWLFNNANEFFRLGFERVRA